MITKYGQAALRLDDVQRAPLPSEIGRGADLSPCGTYRWTLSRRWRDGEGVCFCGLNPSTADATKDDPTIRRLIRFAASWGFGGLVVVNLYPVRTSSPAEAKRWVASQPFPSELGVPMLNNVSHIMAAAEDACFVAAWGAAAWDPSWVNAVCDGVLAKLRGLPVIWCLGTTASGAPIHPMARGRNRVPDDAKPQIWRKRR